ncbi:MAG: ABC transporter permease [Enterococcus devriesei]|uniref:ABC transporter permease n=1 Tax=Enterococcus devriesei TaxID=319970 RepID=UPI003F8E4D50
MGHSGIKIGYLLRTNLKQNRLKHVVWIAILVGLFASAATKFNVLFGTQTDINAIVETLKTPAMVSLFGEFSATKPYTTANVFASEMLVFMGMFMVFMNISLAIGNTRAQEDSGLVEMIRSRTVGRLAPTYATALEILLINGLMGVLYVVSLFVANLNGATMEGDLLMGISIASIGIMFGFISLLLAQLANNARSANFMSYGLYGIFYLMRMMTDVSAPKWTWLSPVGWIQKTAIYTDNRWLPILLTLGLGLISFVAAIKIVETRDIGSGVLTERSGKAQAGKLLSSPLGLVLTVERNSIMGWLIGGIVLGAAYGSIFSTIGDIIGTNPTYKKILGVTQIHAANRELILNFLNMLGLFFVAIAAISGILIIFRLKSDDKKGYLEIIHSKSITKTRLALSYFSVGIITSCLVFVATLAGAFFVGNASMERPLAIKYFWETLGGFLPATLFFVGIASLLTGALPKLTNLLWVYLAGSVLIKMFGPLLNLSEETANISPLGWVGKVPTEALNQSLALVLVAIFLGLTILGIIGYNKRDLE